MGPPLVWVPATVWLYQTGTPGWALFMLIWGFGVVSSIDNFLKPWLISQGSTLPFILIFFGVIGGVFAFGFIGVFLGPDAARGGLPARARLGGGGAQGRCRREAVGRTTVDLNALTPRGRRPSPAAP